MTPSKQAKELGCDSLAQVINASGVSKRTLITWFTTRPWLFDAACEKTAREK